MITYIEAADYGLIEAHLAGLYTTPILDVVCNHTLPVKRLRLNTWAELEVYSSQDADLFGGTEEEERDMLVDIQDLVIDEKVIGFLQGLSQNKKIWLYSSGDSGFNAEKKKLWQKAGFEYIEVKKADESIKKSLAKAYCSQLGLSLSDDKVISIAKQAETYQEIIDTLDFLDLAGVSSKSVEAVTKTEELLLFMLGFDSSKLSSQVMRWYQGVNEDNLQLALSLVFTKLDKQKSSVNRLLQKEVVLTDERIKTRGKIAPLVWWKLFLWKSVHTQTPRAIPV